MAEPIKPRVHPAPEGPSPAEVIGTSPFPVTSLARGLGEREREVMAVLWVAGSANVQQVADKLSTTLAYTTVMTTLDRLFKKGLLRREKRDRAFIYSTALTPREIESKRAIDLIRRFFTDSGERPEILLSCLVDAVEKYDTAMLDQLESRIKEARDQAARRLTNPKSGGGS
jgi:predicted transcriptional regulator